MRNILCLFAIALLMANCGGSPTDSSAANIRLNDSLYFEKTGFNVLVFNNMYDNLFDDSKVSAVEIIHHGVRTATNGDVRLNPSPGQWDPIPKFVDRTVDAEKGRIEVTLNYPAYNFKYTLAVEASGDGVLMSVNTETPIPDELNGIAGLNIELFPPVFWGASYIIDGKTGLFPTVPSADMTTINGLNEPLPIVSGKKIDIAPDVPAKHLTVSVTDDSELSLYDGRSKQQNGTFTLRTLLPAGKSGKIAEWFITGESLSGWKREPVVAYSQVGYHPAQQKIAVIELDKNDNPLSNIVLWKVNADGSRQKALAGKPELWGQYLRYNYLKFNFSEIKESGIYLLEYGKQIAGPFPIAENVYERVWQPTLDVFMPVQMDHIFVREAYRVWHGAAHLDDALQAPVNRTEHWDGWRQGPTTGNKYKPYEHIPGLNVGGWFDAGDFDIQTPSQQSTVQNLVQLYETFHINRDETTIKEEERYAEIHLPDGKPDVLQQIEHGCLQLIGQVKAVGYAITGINESHLYQYRHLGDAVTKTDNKVRENGIESFPHLELSLRLPSRP